MPAGAPDARLVRCSCRAE